MGDLRVGQVLVTKIIAHPSNVGRDLGDLRDLTESVREKGVLVPVILEEHGAGYRLRDGHRRVAAANIAGVRLVTALIHANELDEADWLIESLDYNERRKGYTDDDKRRVALRLIELGVAKSAIAEAFGVPWSRIQRLIDPGAGLQPVEHARAQVTRTSTVISRKTVQEFIDHCDALGYGGQDVLVMLTALVDGRPWRTVDEAAATETQEVEA